MTMIETTFLLFLLFSTITTTLLFTNVVDAVKVAPRSCGGNVRHVHLSVGHDPSTSMIVSFASIPSYYDSDSKPVGGVLVGTSPSNLNQLFLQPDDDDSPSHYNLTSPRKGNYNKDGVKNENVYYSPYYHHITVNNLQPSTTYYYKPIVHPTKNGFKKYYHYLRSANHDDEGGSEDGDLELDETKKKSKSKQETLQTLKDVQDREQVEHDSGRRTQQIQQRRLIQWGPYDGSDKDCPSPDKIRTFRTAPIPHREQPVNLCIVGDIGQFPHSEETLSRMIRSRNDMDAIILAGDVAYTSTDHRRWDTFFDFLDDYPITEHVPMQICPGNHDIDKEPNGTAIFQAYEHRFRMPRIRSPQLDDYDGPKGPMNMDRPPYPLPYEFGNAYYAFTIGSARILMISSYSSMEPRSSQYKWLLTEFDTVDRTQTPWLIAVLHTPLYNTFSLHQKDYQIIAAKEHLEPLFVKHKVNMVFTGHIHAYLRTSTVVHDERDATGPMHITVGAGGRKCEAPFKTAEPESWVEVRDATVYGYGMFRIMNSTHAEWHWIHTGHNDERQYNELWKSNATLPPGPGHDRVFIENQYYAEKRN